TPTVGWGTIRPIGHPWQTFGTDQRSETLPWRSVRSDRGERSARARHESFARACRNLWSNPERTARWGTRTGGRFRARSGTSDAGLQVELVRRPDVRLPAPACDGTVPDEMEGG